MTVRMRHTKSHTGNRRSHHALKKVSLTTCAHCKNPTEGHAVCANCGRYRGIELVDVFKKLNKKERKKKKKELKDQETAAGEDQPLDAAALSKK